MLNQPNIFKTPVAISQSTNLSKGCASGYVTGSYRNKYGEIIPLTCGGFSCEPYGSNYIDCSYCGAFTAGVVAGGVVSVIAGGAIIIIT